MNFVTLPILKLVQPSQVANVTAHQFTPDVIAAMKTAMGSEGPSKTLNNLETREPDKQPEFPEQDSIGMSSPKPVFNGNRARLNNNIRPSSRNQQTLSYSQQHEEIVRYLADSWIRVNRELEVSARNQREDGPVMYREKNLNPRLHDFKAFDLEEFWGKRYLQRVTGSSS